MFWGYIFYTSWIHFLYVMKGSHASTMAQLQKIQTSTGW